MATHVVPPVSAANVVPFPVVQAHGRPGSDGRRSAGGRAHPGGAEPRPTVESVPDGAGSAPGTRVADLRVQFEVHEETGRVVVRVSDAATGEVVREYPSEDLLRVAARMNRWEEAHGLLVDATR